MSHHMTQHQHFERAHRFNAGINQVFMDMVKASDISREELEALIARRPAVYGHLEGWLDRLPSDAGTSQLS